MDPKFQVLEKYFGYSFFRSGQEQLIDGQLSGRDVFGVMPTGGGKSLCYQIPALLLPGVTLVISPLISLMQDQVLALKSSGIPAAYINSALSPEQLRLVYRNLRAGKYKIVYVAPERLLGEGFVNTVRELPIPLVAVDEAHCISQWGQDFRPSYLKIPEFLEQLPKRPVLSAFTATATPVVRQDIVRCLGLREPLLLVTGFDRPNLRFEVRRPESKHAELLTLLALRKEKSGIVYCSTRKDVEQIQSLLESKHFSATRYHAGLTDGERKQNQEDFLYDRKTVMVATNAFGMGIDKSNVSYVIHYNMPQSLEAYYQEAGRAGRDGEKAECILLFGKKDILTGRFFIQKTYEESELPEEAKEQNRQQELQRLRIMTAYCDTALCLRQYILAYFGQQHPGRCENCGSCLKSSGKPARKEKNKPVLRTGQQETRDVTREAQMVLSCIRRIRDTLGYDSTVTVTVRTLRGSQERRLKELGLDRLSTYGLMAAYSAQELRFLIEELDRQGLLSVGKGEIVTLSIHANHVLFRDQPVTVTLDTGELAEKLPRSGTDAGETDSRLLVALKKLRTGIAREEGVPAYVIFSNATLSDMAAQLPKTQEALLQISGVGSIKARKYGGLFLEEIRRYTESGN